MTKKRKSHGDQDAVTSSTSKRSRHENRPRRTDNVAGQSSALPGLDDEFDSGTDETTRDALAYLRMVRSEAQGIPDLLVAPKDDYEEEYDDEEDYDDAGGYYEDGAYIAAPKIGPVMPVGYNTTDTLHGEASHHQLSPQEAYTRRILSLYAKERTSRSSSASKQPFSAQMPTQLPERKAYTSFVSMVQGYPPTPSHLAALDQDTLLQMLYQSQIHMKRRQNLDRRFSAWLWALFCHLGDVGTLDSESVSVIRELGKKAVWVGIGFLGGAAADVTEGYEGDILENEEEDTGKEADSDDHIVKNDEEPETTITAATPEKTLVQSRRRNTSSPEPPDPVLLQQVAGKNITHQSNGQIADLELARRRLLEQLAIEEDENGVNECPDANTRATIDMIIAIAGEIYGQRDLLEFRAVWGGEMGLWG